MSQKTAVFITIIVALVASMLAAVVTRLFIGPMNWPAFIGWVIFFASLQTPVVMQAARTGKLDVCSARLAHLFGRH